MYFFRKYNQRLRIIKTIVGGWFPLQIISATNLVIVLVLLSSGLKLCILSTNDLRVGWLVDNNLRFPGGCLKGLSSPQEEAAESGLGIELIDVGLASAVGSPIPLVGESILTTKGPNVGEAGVSTGVNALDPFSS